jgi:hypothetical protein
MNKIVVGFLMAFTAAMVLFFSNLTAKRDSRERVEEKIKSEPNHSISVLESGDLGNGSHFLIMLDKKTNSRVLYFSGAMVVLPQ